MMFFTRYYLASLAIFVTLLVSLNGCQAIGGAAGGAALVSAVPQIIDAINMGTSVLSDVGKASCAAQTVTNKAVEIATMRNDPAMAARLSQASAIVGIGCNW